MGGEATMIPLPEGCRIRRSGAAPGWKIIITPYLDPHFDHLEIGVQEMRDHFLFSDLSDCYGTLTLNGFDESKIIEHISRTVQCTKATYKDFCIEIVTKDKSISEFLAAYHTLITSMIEAYAAMFFREVMV
jgi:hypothetical protein